MITELALFGLVGYGYYRNNHKDELQIKDKWDKIMVGAGIKNKQEDNKTYLITKISRTAYGFNCRVNIPDGLSFERLESMRKTIEDNMKCLCEFTKDNFSNYAYMKIITNPQNNLTFKPVKSKPFELLIGYDYSGKAIFINMNKFPHLLIGGVTGTGKSRLNFIILTNLIHNHNEKEIELYLTQVRKKDLKHFKNCNQVKWYAEDLQDTKLMFQHVDRLIQRREDIIEKAGAENIDEFNKISKIKMKYDYVFAEEFSFYMPDASDNEDTAKLKAETLGYLKNIILSGRGVGVFVITSVQRTTIDNIPSTIKSQMSRITFRQMSDLNSINIIECGDAVGLQNQEAILFTNEYKKIKTPFIDKNIIHENIKYSLPDNQQVKVQEKVQDNVVRSFKWHIPTKEEWKEIKDSIPLINAPELMKPIGQLPRAKKNKKNGVISLSEVKNSVNA
jgi:S-DNA-T family DNA segregation ATPase FtsK/SpoIIIE